MSKFIKVAKDKIMVKLNIDGIGEKWTTCSQAVKDFAKTAFKEGDDVHIQYEDGKNNMFHVTRIEKGTGADVKKEATASSESSSTNGKPTCEDCGKELKDAKYKKCWACNKNNPAKKTGGSYGKTPEVQESIKRQAIGHMTSRSLIAMQGQVDINNITGFMETLYKKYQELVG